jgi:DNA polymerase (family 10)
LSEQSLTRIEGGNPMPIAEEQDLYRHLGLSYVEPELREDRGEIEAAQTGSLPHLIGIENVLGDLHVRSDWDTGAHSLEDIARVAQKMGYAYVAICDPISASASGYGITPALLREQIATIRHLNATFPESFRLLAGAEVEISPEGTLEIDEAILQELDMVIAAIHTGLKEPRYKITRRLCRAMAHPLVNILAHPTGRMLGKPEVPSIDVEALIETAVETHTCLEINSHMLRLDLPDIYIQQARNLGVTFSLGSHAHTIQEMRTLRLGVTTARRGWVEPKQLLNALPYPALLQRLKNQDVTHVT